MTWHSKALGLIATVSILTACSGGSVGSSSPIATQPTGPAHKTSKLKVRFSVPMQNKMASLVKGLAKVYAQRKPHFIGLATTEIDITLTEVNAAPPGTTIYNTVVYTEPGGIVNPGCTRNNTYGYDCFTVLTAPSATDTYNVSAKWCADPNADGSCPGAATLISEGNFSVVVPPGGGGNANLTLDPVVGSIDWAPVGSNYYYNGLETWTNGSAAPVISGTGYACPGGGCYDPLLNAAPSTTYGTPATPTWDYLFLQPEDANGDIIVPVIGRGSFTNYSKPLYLTSTGAVDSISSTCVDKNGVVDPDVELINYDGSDPDASPVPVGDLVNGFTGSGSVMNAPYNIRGATTDLNGNPVTAQDNNTFSVNFDGGSASYDGTSVDNCQATDSSTPPLHSSKYYLGYAFGTVVVIDQKHRHK
jgi:hypothetical protein